MNLQRGVVLAGLLSLLWLPAPAAAQEAAGAEADADAEKTKIDSVLQSIKWEKGPVEAARVGDQGQLKVPEGFVFTGGPGTRQMLELMKNPTSGSELGLLAPVTLSWFLIFEFQSIGYVKDADKEKLDAEEMLDSIKRGTEESNKQRKARGWPEITIEGWQTAPFFDGASKNLQWCIKGRSQGHLIVNYNTRLLGRAGVMSANLLVAPEKLDDTLATVKSLLGGFSFQEGKRYSEYQKGDRIAEYGLAALVVGGAAAAAAKLGLFGKLFAMVGKLWKLLLVGLIALGAGLKALFTRRGGGGKAVPPADPPADPEGGG